MFAADQSPNKRILELLLHVLIARQDYWVWDQTQLLGKGVIEVIADMDLDPDSLSQVEEAFISAGLL